MRMSYRSPCINKCFVLLVQSEPWCSVTLLDEPPSSYYHRPSAVRHVGSPGSTQGRPDGWMDGGVKVLMWKAFAFMSIGNQKSLLYLALKIEIHSVLLCL